MQELECCLCLYNTETNALTDSLAARPSDSLGLLNYGRPFFPIDCLLSPYLNLHLTHILFYIFQPSQSRSSLLLLPASLLSNIFLAVLPRSILTTCPIHSNLFSLISATMCRSLIKSRRMRWVGHVVRMGEERGVYRVLVGKLEGKRPLGRPRRRWMDNIRMDLQEVGCGYMDCIGLAQDRDRWRTLVSAVMNLWFP